MGILHGHTAQPQVSVLASSAEHCVSHAQLLRKAGSALGASSITMGGLMALNTSKTTADMPLSGADPLPIWSSPSNAARVPQFRENPSRTGEG